MNRELVTMPAPHGGRLEILPTQHEIQWPDGTTVALHPVRENGVDSLYIRALGMPGGMLIVFDLRKVCPPLAEDLKACPPRDVPGVVFYSLRQWLHSAAAMVNAATRERLALWIPAPQAVAA